MKVNLKSYRSRREVGEESVVGVKGTELGRKINNKVFNSNFSHRDTTGALSMKIMRVFLFRILMISLRFFGGQGSKFLVF